MRAPGDRFPTWLLAVSGTVLVVASGLRWGIPALAWVAPVPWMLWIRRTRRWREAFVLLLVLALATVGQLLKIATPPVPPVFAAGVGVPLAFGTWVVLVVWDALRRRTSEVLALYAWPALIVVGEWSSYASGPMGVWGTGASNRPDDLALLQLAGLFGVAAIGGVMAWVSAWIAGRLAAPDRLSWRHGALLGAVLVAVYAHGAWRLARPAEGVPTVPVAAVVTDVGFSPAGLPDDEVLDAAMEDLFARSARAAARGARVIVWNEGAAVVAPEDEPAFLARSAAFARDRGVDLVVAYLVVRSAEPFRFDNVAVFVDDTGAVRARYHKRHPVPGEGEPSDNPVPRIARPYGVVSLAICYDHDHPEMSRGHARVGADLVFVPSSDWPGIDPFHTLFARVRAIEGGFSSLRPTRWAASAGFDPEGRVRGWMRADEDNGGVLVVDLPVGRRRTLYAAVGDVPAVAGASLVLLGVLVRAFRRRRTMPG